MFELAGNVELVVINMATGTRHEISLSAKDFSAERRFMFDDDILHYDDEGEFVAYVNEIDIELKVLVSPPNVLTLEEPAVQYEIQIIKNALEFVAPEDEAGQGNL